MNPLLYVMTIVSLGMIAFTLYAILSAPLGYEDEQGFHSIRTRRKASLLSAEGKERRFPRFIPVH